jgi:hypothetical protein
MLTFRKTTRAEDETWGIKCGVIKTGLNLQCSRRVTRVVNYNLYYCEGHFQVLKQKAEAAKDYLNDLDEPKENATGQTEPLEKSS